MSKTSGLTVRQHEREGVEVPFELEILPAHGAQVRFSPSSAAATPQMVRGVAIDISSGGMGLRCRMFVPRMCEGIVRVFGPGEELSGSAPSAITPMFEQRVKVRRVTLIGREPTYSVGVAFVDPQPDLEQNIARLFERLDSLTQRNGTQVASIG